MATSLPQVAKVINENFVNQGHHGQADSYGSERPGKYGKRPRHDDDAKIKDTVTRLLGNTQVAPVLSRNLDLMTGYPHSTTGIPYAIQGARATDMCTRVRTCCALCAI